MFKIEEMRERLCLPAGKPPDHAPQPERQWRRFTHRQVFFAFGGFHFLLFCKRSPLPESRCILRPKRSALHPLPRIRGYSAAVQSDVFQGQGSALIETEHRAELVLPPDALLPVTLHRHSVKEACVLAIQRGILATTAECLLIFYCAERNKDKAGLQARLSLSPSFMNPIWQHKNSSRRHFPSKRSYGIRMSALYGACRNSLDNMALHDKIEDHDGNR